MRHMLRFFPLMLMLICLALTGCGSSDSTSGATVNDQFAAAAAAGGGGGGGGVIMFTSAANLTPGSQTNMLESISKEVPVGSGRWSFLPLIPFKVTDSNGNPRVGAKVTLYVYSITSKNPNDVTIDFLVPTTIEGSIIGTNPEPNQQTITTDSAGMGIFNVGVTLIAPTVEKSVNTANVVFKAETMYDTIPVTAYVGQGYSLTTP